MTVRRNLSLIGGPQLGIRCEYVLRQKVYLRHADDVGGAARHFGRMHRERRELELVSGIEAIDVGANAQLHEALDEVEGLICIVLMGAIHFARCISPRDGPPTRVRYLSDGFTFVFEVAGRYFKFHVFSRLSSGLGLIVLPASAARNSVARCLEIGAASTVAA